MRILIVEDKFLLGMLIADTLVDAGHEVSGPAASVEEALRLATTKVPDLALLDIELRGGGSGLDVARELSKRGIPCIFVTGQIAVARANRELALGLMAKPCLPMSLVGVIGYAAAASDPSRPLPARPPAGFEPFAIGAAGSAGAAAAVA